MCAIVGYLLHLCFATYPPGVYLTMKGEIAGVIIGILLVTLIVLLHVYGLYFRHPIWMIPFMIMQILLMIALLVATMILAVRLGGKELPNEPSSSSTGDSSDDVRLTTIGTDGIVTETVTTRSSEFYWRIGGLAACVVAALLHLWFFVVALTAYRYVKAVMVLPKTIHEAPRVDPLVQAPPTFEVVEQHIVVTET